MLQNVALRSAIPEGNVPEFHLTLYLLQHFWLWLIPDFQLCLEHFLNTDCGYAGPGHHHKHHGDHQEGGDNLHGILDKGHHVADLQRGFRNGMAAYPHNHYRYHVHDEHHRGHHGRHDPLYKAVGIRQIFVGGLKTLLLIFLIAEGTHHHHSAEILPAHQVQPVNELLQGFKFGHGNGQRHNDQPDHYNYGHGDDPAHGHAFAYRKYDAANAHDGRIAHHSNSHGNQHLHLLHIVGGTGDQGSCGELVKLRIGKTLHLGKQVMA